MVARESLAIRETQTPDAWTTFNSQAILGAALLGQTKYADAEPLLLEAHAWHSAHAGPGADSVRRTAAALIELYDGWGNPAAADAYRDMAAEPTR